MWNTSTSLNALRDESIFWSLNQIIGRCSSGCRSEILGILFYLHHLIINEEFILYEDNYTVQTQNNACATCVDNLYKWNSMYTSSTNKKFKWKTQRIEKFLSNTYSEILLCTNNSEIVLLVYTFLGLPSNAFCHSGQFMLPSL